MKLNLRFYTLAAAAITLLAAAGCQRSLKTSMYSDDFTYALNDECPDSLSFELTLEYPVAGASEEALSKMTDAILDLAFDLEDGYSTVEETAAAYEDALKEGYTENAGSLWEESKNDPPQEGLFAWEDCIHGYFSGGKGDLVSYVVEYYTYTGGVHGFNTLTPIVLSKETGEVVDEADFFVEDYLSPVSDLLQERLKGVFDDPDEYDGLFVKEIEPNGNFEVGKAGVTYYYQPYEIGAFYLGVIPVTLPWSDLKGLVRER